MPELRAKGWRGQMPPSVEKEPALTQGRAEETKVPQLKDLVGSALNRFEDVTGMDYTAQVVPQIDKDHCVNCGKCYLTCLDIGYQAIGFEREDDHLPFVKEEHCTGCGLCMAVCPVTEALFYVPRTVPYKVDRGTKVPPGLARDPKVYETFTYDK